MPSFRLEAHHRTPRETKTRYIVRCRSILRLIFVALFRPELIASNDLHCCLAVPQYTSVVNFDFPMFHYIGVGDPVSRTHMVPRCQRRMATINALVDIVVWPAARRGYVWVGSVLTDGGGVTYLDPMTFLRCWRFEFCLSRRVFDSLAGGRHSCGYLLNQFFVIYRNSIFSLTAPHCSKRAVGIIGNYIVASSRVECSTLMYCMSPTLGGSIIPTKPISTKIRAKCRENITPHR